MSDIFEKILQIADGNPGVGKVLAEIAKKDESRINPIHAAILITKSDSTLIWIVYKDICDYDIDKTISYLVNWYTNSSIDLNKYIKIYNPEARHH